jgi:serine/threonine protein kinase
MDGAAWSAITAETKDLVRRLLVVDPKARLTIEEALQHEVFHAPRFTRVDGELLCIEAIYEEEDSVDASVIAPPSSSNETLNDNNVENAENKQKNRSRSVPLISIIGAKICAKKLSKKISKIQDARFNARATFKTAITCVRFLIRLLHIRTTPELLCLRQARINPYQIRSYRITIDREAFGLYHHWIKKGEGQDRAAVFQHFPKKDLKGKKTDQLLRPAL